MQQLRLQQRQLQEQHSWREEQEGLGTGLGQTAARCRRHQLEGGVSAEQKPGYSLPLAVSEQARARALLRRSTQALQGGPAGQQRRLRE